MRKELRDLLTRPHETRVRAPRIPSPNTVLVESSTIGTGAVYPLQVENMSRSGLLLSWTSEHPVPFIENTLLEMCIDPGTQLLGTPLKCLGKVVRRTEVASGSNHAVFGIHIIQMETYDLERWESTILEGERVIEVAQGTPVLDLWS